VLNVEMPSGDFRARSVPVTSVITTNINPMRPAAAVPVKM